mgnify:CR=1 FL=1
MVKVGVRIPAQDRDELVKRYGSVSEGVRTVVNTVLHPVHPVKTAVFPKVHLEVHPYVPPRRPRWGLWVAGILGCTGVGIGAYVVHLSLIHISEPTRPY